MRFSISLKITCAILLCLFIQGILILGLNAKFTRESLLNETELDARVQSAFLQQTISFLILKNDLNQVQDTVSTIASDPQVNAAYLLADDFRIIVSTHVAENGKNLKNIVNTRVLEQLENQTKIILEKKRSGLWYSEDGRSLYVISPINLGKKSEKTIRTDRVGFLLVDINLSRIENHIKSSFLRESFSAASIMLAITVLLILFFNFAISKRIQKVKDATGQFKLGQAFQAIPIKGNDEITDLYLKFDLLTQQINEQHAELHESERRLNLSQEIAKLGSWELDLVNNKLTWSNEVYRIFGLSKEEFPATYEGFLQAVHPDDREKVNKAYSQSIEKNQDEYSVEHRIIQKPNNEVRFVLEKCVHYRNKKGNIIRSVGMIHDITESKLANQKIKQQKDEQQQILNNIVDAVISIDSNGNVLSFNKAAERIFQYDESEVIGNNVSSLMPEPDSSNHNRYLSRYLKTGNPHIIGIGREVIAMRKDKSTFPIRLSVAELPNDEFGGRRFIGTCQDISELKAQEEQLRQSQKMEALGNLTGGIAHDFNNMLSVMLGYAELLSLQITDNDKQMMFINEVIQAAQRGKKLTAKLLAISRKKVFQSEVVDLRELILEEKNLLETTLTVKINLKMELPKNLWPVFLDRASLEDSILNICINAMHAMPDGGTLTIEARNIYLANTDGRVVNLPSGDYVVMTFTDTGIGMDEKTRQKIFDPFFTTKNQGTGLGMSQVYGFVLQSKGAIQVFSEVGHGTRIAIYLPRSLNESQADGHIEIENRKPNLTGDEKILVVDDEPALRSLAREVLTSNGYNVFLAENGKAALEVLEKERVDLMLTDVIMPEMDGYKLVEIVRQKYPEIKIQLASGFTSEHKDKLVEMNLQNSLLEKPYTSRTLLYRIRKLLDEDPK